MAVTKKKMPAKVKVKAKPWKGPVLVHGGHRAGAGRPAVFVSPTRVLVTMEAAAKEKIEQLAAARGESLAAVLRDLILRGLQS